MNPIVENPTIAEMRASWKAHGFPIMESNRKTDGNVNDPQGQPLAEHWLWAQLILESIDDLRGTSMMAKQNCRACHRDAQCQCRTLTFERRHIIQSKRDNVWRVKLGESRRPYVITPTVCELQPDGETYFYKHLSNRCPMIHTYQNCAKNWFASDGFETVCGLLGLDAGYMRQKITRIASEEEQWTPLKLNHI